MMELADCLWLFKENQLAPDPAALFANSVHRIQGPNIPFFNHEYGGFTKVLRRENAEKLCAGRYTIKIVIENISSESKVDSGIFLAKDGVTFIWFYAADFDNDGDVDGDDFLIWQSGFGISKCASRFEGDADNDGDVDGNDFLIWQAEFGGGSSKSQGGGGGGNSATTGNTEAKPFSTDFNKDGTTNAADVATLQSQPGFDTDDTLADNDVNGIFSTLAGG